MAIQSERFFRVSLAGFNRQDVLDFITNSARERREEVEAYRVGADKLRGERDAFREEAKSAQEHVQAQTKELELVSARCEELLARLEENRAELDEIRDENERLNSVILDYEKKIDGLNAKILDYEKEFDGFKDIKAKIADLDERARRWAETVEADAARNAQKARESLISMVSDIRKRYDAVLADSEVCAYTIVKELDRMRDWFVRFPDIFSAIDERISAIAGTINPVSIIRDFVPREFDE